MALTAVDLSDASKRVTPTLDHDLIFGSRTAAIGARAGVASVQALKDLIGGLDTTGIDARVATWARENSPSGTAPPARLGTGTASTSVFLRGDGAWVAPPASVGSGGLDTTGVDARIATWARAASPSGTAPAARLGTGASDTRFLRGDGTWQIVTGLLVSSLPSMDKYAKGNVSTTSTAIPLATLRAQCVETNRDNAYVPPDPITSNFMEPSGDFYILRQRFLLSTLARWSNLRLMLDVRPDDTVLVFALLSDRFGRLTGDQLAVAGAAYSQTSAGMTTVNDAITLSDWGSADSDSKWWVMLEVYCIEGSGGQQLDYKVGYTPDGASAVAPADVNAVGGLATVNTYGEQPASLTLGTGLAVVGTVLTAPAGATPANWALASGASGQAPVARLGTGTPSHAQVSARRWVVGRAHHYRRRYGTYPHFVLGLLSQSHRRRADCSRRHE